MNNKSFTFPKLLKNYLLSGCAGSLLLCGLSSSCRELGLLSSCGARASQSRGFSHYRENGAPGQYLQGTGSDAEDPGL